MRFRYYLTILIVTGLILYSHSLKNNFVWDDEEQVVANSAVHTISNIPQLLSGSTFNSGGAGSPSGLYYKPLMSISFAFIYNFFGENPTAFHLFQILLHLGSTCLFFLLLVRLMKDKNISFFASLIFMIHPINVESVVYISTLQDALFMFFGLLALTLNTNFYLTAVLLFLSIMSKETGIIFYFLIGFYMALYRKKDFVRYISFSSISFGLYLFLRLGLAHIYLEKNFFTPIAHLSLIERLISTPAIIFHYLTTFFYPARLLISQHWIVKNANFKDFWLPFLLSAVFFGVLTYLVTKHQKKHVVFFYVWLLVSLLFHSQIFPLDMTVADRWFYLPSMGLIALLATTIKIKRPIVYVLIPLIIILFIRSYIRIGDWKDGLTLYSHDIKYVSGSFDLENNYGVELYRTGKYIEAGKHFKNSTEIAPTWWTNWNNLGVIEEGDGNLDKASEHYLHAIENGNYYLAYGNYAKILIKQGKEKEALKFIKDSLKILPENTELNELYKLLLDN